MIKIPEFSFCFGEVPSNLFAQRLLAPKFHKNKPELWRSELDGITGIKPLIMFVAGERMLGYAAGTHDGIRDGDFSGRLELHTARVYYTTQDAWIEAGNKMFW